MELCFRKATKDDLKEIMELLDKAIKVMEKDKIYQWDEYYPVIEDFMLDIELQQLYVGSIESQIAVIYTLNREYDEQFISEVSDSEQTKRAALNKQELL